MQFLSLNAYDRHKMLVNEYLLSYAGASEKVLHRDTSKDKTDMDVIRENHKVWSKILIPIFSLFLFDNNFNTFLIATICGKTVNYRFSN